MDSGKQGPSLAANDPSSNVVPLGPLHLNEKLSARCAFMQMRTGARVGAARVVGPDGQVARYLPTHPVMHMSNSVPLENPGALELDVFRIKVVEETAPLAQEDRDEMNLELIENAVGECELCSSGAMNQDVLVTRRLLGLSHRSADVGHVAD